MYELIKAGNSSFYLDCPTKIGICTYDDGSAIIIDSGGDKSAGRKIRQILDENGWKLKAILNTHFHADHVGGNKYLQSQTGCNVFAPAMEVPFIKYPVLEPSQLYAGFPPNELRHKFLMAQESDAMELTSDLFPADITPIPLPGHSFEMVGYMTADGVAYIADCISSASTLDKYGIPFIYDVGSFLDTLDKVEAMEARLFVPSHAEATDDIAPLVQYNRKKILEAADRVLDACTEPTTLDDMLKKLFDSYGLTLNFQQYVLVGSTVRSFLAWLLAADKVSANFDDNRLLWSKK